MSLSTLFEIKELVNEEQLIATIQIDKNHIIFDGHFPNNPIVPGVCLMEMVKRVIAQHLEKKCTIVGTDNVKFLAVLNPVESEIVSVKVDIKKQTEDEVSFMSSIYNDETIFVKFKGRVKVF